MSKKILIYSLVALLTSIIIITAYTIFNPAGYTRELDGYSIQSRSGHTPLCGIDTVRNREGEHIVTLQLCEDNIRSIQERDGFIVITTYADRIYMQNLKTGEETLDTAGKGLGGVEIIDTLFE